MLMAGIVSASWLRLVPLRDLDLRLFGTATTRFSELLVRRNLYAVHTTISRHLPKTCGGLHDSVWEEKSIPFLFVIRKCGL
jgi:hypothetical protein